MSISIFGGKQRAQPLVVWTEDGRIVVDEGSVEKGYVVDHKTMEAWGLSAESCVRKRGTDTPYLLISEREFAPLPLSGRTQGHSFASKELDRIAAESCDQELAQIAKKSIRNKIADTVRLIVTIFAVMVGVLVIVTLLTSGVLHVNP